MKLIIRAPNWVGDAVMALPTIDAARELTGADHMAVMARAATAPLFANHPDVDRVIVIDDKKSVLAGPKQAAAAIKDDAFEVGLILPPSFSSALIFKLAGVKGRVGYASDKRSLLLTRAENIPAEPMHRARLYLHLLEQTTDQKAKFHNPRLYLSHEDIEAGEQALAAESLSYDDPYIVISPRAIAESRRWGTDNYGTLAGRLSERYACRVVTIGTADDVSAGEEVKGHAPETIINLCGKTSLPGAAAIISFSRLFVGNDSGLAHVAAAVGVPLVVLSGPDDPGETSPLSDRKEVIIKDIECIQCVKNICPKKGDAFMRCMKLITVDEVFDAATELYKTA
jgi:heptosyltransferase-2